MSEDEAGDDDLCDMGPLEFFERYRQLPSIVRIAIPVRIEMPAEEDDHDPHIIYCGKHVHVSLPPEMPYGKVFAILTQAYAVARAFTVSCGMHFDTPTLVNAADEVAVALCFDADSIEGLRTSIASWHSKVRVVGHLN